MHSFAHKLALSCNVLVRCMARCVQQGGCVPGLTRGDPVRRGLDFLHVYEVAWLRDQSVEPQTLDPMNPCRPVAAPGTPRPLIRVWHDPSEIIGWVVRSVKYGLGGDLLYITTTPPTPHEEDPDITDDSYQFSGYFLPYPGASHEGLVSMISDDPLMRNWIYVDKNTYEVKYGFQIDAEDHITGPFDCTWVDQRMTLEGWEGFVAVEDYPGVWALYFDRDDDGLATKVPMGTRVLDIELTRREQKERRHDTDDPEVKTPDELLTRHRVLLERQEEEINQFLHGKEQSQYHRPSTSSNHEPADFVVGADKADVNITSVGMEKLSLDIDEILDIRGESAPETPTAASPSAISDSFSFWSVEEADDVSDIASVTAASSIDTDHSTNITTQDCEGPKYKKPYVEDVTGNYEFM
ncbi:hypothetical protein NUW58_g8029 [Xylaria curta]|uniref:Uncharacterized protein n=1 Tax=Xylaria curta TaxID=42375 RepID=A0ACC1NDH5_9PEZI|nr:hypothetical protein NUW58_g8029 [Xylaria curta]